MRLRVVPEFMFLQENCINANNNWKHFNQLLYWMMKLVLRMLCVDIIPVVMTSAIALLHNL